MSSLITGTAPANDPLRARAPDGATLESRSSHYDLMCSVCGRTVAEDGYVLTCPGDGGLLVTSYTKRRFVVDTERAGLFRYRHWLPQSSDVTGSATSLTYRSELLCRMTGADVWVAFNGYWPERGGLLPTGTFKDLEAYTVLSRAPRNTSRILVVASAGNTALAFAEACAINHRRCVIVVPESALPMALGAGVDADTVRLVALGPPADYNDAIEFANRIAEQPRFCKEGGGQNVGRRDGIGTVLLNAVEAIGRLPDFYFQAIGGGVGAVGVHEAAKRLIEDGRFGQTLPRQLLSQNLPYVPMYLAWRARRRGWITPDSVESKILVAQIAANVLSSRTPLYAASGGVYDTLTESGGDMLVADNGDVKAALSLFEASEHIDIEPPGGVALATLLKASRDDQIPKGSVVLLNITGGGRRRRARGDRLQAMLPDLVLSPADLASPRCLERVDRLFH